MKLTAKELRQIIDTLPNPHESRAYERRVHLMQRINPLVKESIPQYIDGEEVIFKFDIRANDWELEIDPSRDALNQMKHNYNVLQQELNLLKHNYSLIHFEANMANKQLNSLRSKWFVKLYFKWLSFKFYIKFKISRYALHRFTRL